MMVEELDDKILDKAGRIGYLLRKAQHATRLKIDRALQQYSITHPQFAVLSILGYVPQIHSADVARISMFSPQVTNIIITNLEKRGLIKKTAHKTHGRMLTITLTNEGKKKLKLCRAKVDAIEANMMLGLSAKDDAVIRSWLARCITDKEE